MIRRSAVFISLAFALNLSAQEVAESTTGLSAGVEQTAPGDASVPVNALMEQLRQSGKTGMALFIISIIGFSFAFERLFNLRKSNVTPLGLARKADEFWRAGDMEAVKKLAAQSTSALGRVIVEIAEHKEAPRADINMMAGDVASREMRHHLQKAYPLAVVATISPLLGLFGTVYGMIGAFQSVALAGEMGDPSIMAGDISYALITTALGLVIAVPSLSAYHFFRIRTNLLALDLEEQCSHLINRWYDLQTKASGEEG